MAELSAADESWLKQAIALSQQSRANGNHPFASVVVGADGKLLAQAENTHRIDCTCHAEMNAVRGASAAYGADALRGATLYSSAEPCAMCAGGIYWSGIGRVVYALSE